jgi:hypothetical protein
MLHPSTTSSGSSAAGRRLIGAGLAVAASSRTRAERIGRKATGLVRLRTSGSGTRAARSAGATGPAASTRSTTSLSVGCDLPGELPEVVARRAAEGPDRCLLALAGHAADATHRHPRLLGILRLLRILDPWCGLRHARRDELPLAFLGKRILVFLPEVPAFDEHVDVRRKGAGLSLIGGNRARVLIAAKDRFFFLLALGLMSPHRHGDGHEDGHDGHHDEQGRHRVSTLAAPNGLTS